VTLTTDVDRERLVAKAVLPTGVGPDGAALPPNRSRGASVVERDTHLLRLSLDLQLDAMLLVLGASAVGRPEDAMPWRRWLEEDVDLAWELTTTALAVHGGLPPSLGPDLATADPRRLTEDLLARYTSMCSLLEDLLAREAGRSEDASVDVRDPDGTGPVWHEHIRAALGRYQTRVDELRAHQSALARGSGRPVERPSAPASVARPPTRAYLPGELLG
jgi:hypothetical protein